MVSEISMSELCALQEDYSAAQKEGHEWIMQAMDIVFEKIDLGKIKVRIV
jgi:hypothetical protein